MSRPTSLLEISRRAQVDAAMFDPAVREFLDCWQLMTKAQRLSALSAEPIPVGKLQDAYLGALAEHLSLTEGRSGPKWSENASRFLHEPFFSGGLESLKAILIVQSPLAFRRRLIFVSADALSRPPRALSDDNSPKPHAA